MTTPPAPKEKKEKFEWADEGLSALVRVVILGWSAAILTLNYVTVPGIPQRQIDPTFIASVFTTTLIHVRSSGSKEKGGGEKGRT